MEGRSSAFDETVQGSHTAVSGASIIQNGKVVGNLEIFSGSVSADRTAAQMRSFEVDAVDRHGTLIPTDMRSTLAPFGTRIQLYRGVRIKATQTVGVMHNAANPWTPQTPIGVMNGVKIDTDGGLILGP